MDRARGQRPFWDWTIETNNHSRSHLQANQGHQLTCMSLDCGRKPESRENPGRHGENVQTLHRKVLPQPGIEPRTS